MPSTQNGKVVAMLSRPESTEFAAYHRNYIASVPEGDILDILAKQPGEYRQLLTGITDSVASDASRKWSIKQMLGHVCDAERVMSYRALRFARGDETELPGFEQDDYVREANSNARTLDDLLTEFEALRKSTVALFRSLPPETEKRRGIANGNPLSVRALAYIAAGHAQHHYDAIKTRLQDDVQPSRAQSRG